MFKALFEYVLKSTALQRARWSTVTIMAIAAAVSYFHQKQLLLDWDVDRGAAIAVPLTVDLLAITCTIVLHNPEVARYGWWISLLVLIAAVAVSGVANFLAGDNPIEKAANMWTVVAYLLSELVAAAAKVKAKVKDPVRVKAGVKAAETKKANGRKAPARGTSRTKKVVVASTPALEVAA